MTEYADQPAPRRIRFDPTRVRDERLYSRAYSHSRWVRRLKFILPAIAVAAVVGFFLTMRVVTGTGEAVISNAGINVPREDWIERVIVPAGPDVADDWIAERAAPGAVVVTADVPLAARCVKAGAEVLAPNGKAFDQASIGMALATRNLMDSLRSAGEITGGPKPFAPRDRSAFLSALDRVFTRLKRSGFGAPAR